LRFSQPVSYTRRILCVFPAYTPAFGTFAHAYRLMHNVQAFMPPQGLLLIAAYMPEHWPVRFIDENIARATGEDFAWADAVFVSGMHIQAAQIHDIARRAKAAGKVTALGGPSVSSVPEMYPDYDYLHVGELGDSTNALVAQLDESCAPPQAQVRFQTKERLGLNEFPIPAYHLVPLSRYLMCTLQFSSGCPYLCEFCDIPNLYGRQPRYKTPEQITAELDVITSQTDHPSQVYFVDDNFIGNRKAAREMLPHVVEWQKQRGYPMQFACEATLNIAKQSEILALMREAAFVGIFVGIETPEADALSAMRKDQNNSLPMMEAIKTLNEYGLEVISGIILGLDTDSDDTEQRLKDFIDLSNIPTLTINLLQALPKTPLWDRLKRENRLIEDEGRDSNVDFFLPYDDVVATWRACMGSAYEPAKLLERYEYQIRETYPKRLQPRTPQQATWKNIKLGLTMLRNIFWKVGILGDYKREFWKFALRRLARGEIEHLIASIMVAHHLINFARDASGGQTNASYYSLKLQEASVPAE